MERFKALMKKIFCLKPLMTVLISVPSFIFVFAMLGMGNKGYLSYISYGLSAYALIILITGMPDIIKAVRRNVHKIPLVKKMRSIPVLERYFSDALFRQKISLYFGFLINIFYVAVKFFFGIYYRSTWFISLAVYYILLAVMRFLLLHHVNGKAIGQDMAVEYRRYRYCGFMLLFMNQALAGIVIFMVHQNRGFDYPGLLIYAMAMYSFYAVITAVINVVKYRSHESPVLSAARAINLVAAMVSILSLETAMLAQFGGDDEVFRANMTGATGGSVCTIVIVMAVYMIVKSTRQLKDKKIIWEGTDYE